MKLHFREGDCQKSSFAITNPSAPDKEIVFLMDPSVIYIHLPVYENVS
jgi:hypothetical protein